MSRSLHTFFILLLIQNVVNSLKLIVSNNGPVVRGSNITFTATVLGYSDEDLKFSYWDDVQPQHREDIIINTNISTWTVEYPRNLYEAGEYTVTVELLKNYFGLWIKQTSGRTTFQLTDSLHGNLILTQNNTVRSNRYVAVNSTVKHAIQLPNNEMQFLKQNASSIVTYWFIDCMFIDQTMDFTLNYTYTDLMVDHYIDALVVANNEPLPPITTTTTTTSTTTTTTSTTTTTTTTTTPKPTTDLANVSVPLTHKIMKREVAKRKHAIKDFICNNSSIVPIGETYTYGHYQETISIREPINTVNITGLNWLQHGDLLNLQVKYTGSPPFDFCAIYKLGQYNVTGNETCNIKSRTESKVFPLVHYFSDSDQHTVVVVVENVLGKSVSRATINIYKAAVHAQLSVIVVPVAFSFVAVILVVFGIAYYQHRSRHTIEVADFDFGQQVIFDYKTFAERLRESFRSAFNFQRGDTDPLTDTRYDSM